MPKLFRLSKEQIFPLAEGLGACMATDYITVHGHPVRFMYREEPDNEIDSGWRFMSGMEDDYYINNPENLAIYDINTVANYDPTIIEHLHSPIGTALEKEPHSEHFMPVEDWDPSQN